MRTKQRKKRLRPRLPMELPALINQRWSMDFVSDQLASGRRFRVLNVVDDFSRELIGQLVAVSISGPQALTEARYEIELWQQHYNTIRPHSSLNYLSPAQYVAKVA